MEILNTITIIIVVAVCIQMIVCRICTCVEFCAKAKAYPQTLFAQRVDPESIHKGKEQERNAAE